MSWPSRRTISSFRSWMARLRDKGPARDFPSALSKLKLPVIAISRGALAWADENLSVW